MNGLSVGMLMYEEYDDSNDDELENDFVDTDDDDGICKKCKGNGKYQVRTEQDGEVTVSWKYCEPCKGTGLESGDGDVD